MTMINPMKYKILGIVGFICLNLYSCSAGNSNDDKNSSIEDIIPTNLSLTIGVNGVDAGNPNGDGTGVIQCSAAAVNAVRYVFRIENEDIQSANGNLEYRFNDEGTNSYTITVLAYSSTGNEISTSETINVYVNNTIQLLVWSDEFNVNGAPDGGKWGYDIGTGNDGWGNRESQYYTSRADNVIVQDGHLIIKLKKESYEGSEYTSTRMLTKEKYEFTYGRVEVRAKLPEGGGTWPAIWMLGSNIATAGWPACGEIDIMEHRGNAQGTISSAMHTPSSFGGTVNKGEIFVADASEAFHVYTVDWTASKMDFYVDDTLFYTYNPANKNSTTWPFDANQFIILNVAMGGTFGGNIASGFTETTMEIDYVRVYQ